MNSKICKHHGLPVVSGYFCEKCVVSLKEQQDQLNRFFNSPKVVEAINKVFEKQKAPSPENA